MIDDRSEPDAGPRRRKGSRRSRSSTLFSVVVGLAVLAAGGTAGGFLRFADEIAGLEQPTSVPPSDAIVVLTGGYARIENAIDLLKQGVGKRLLISGVNPVTTDDEMRRVTDTSPALFECCVDLGREAVDTASNADETARWVRSNGFDSIILVTNNYHMPRSLLELARIDHRTEIIPFPVVNSDLKNENWITDPEVIRTLFYEYAKYTAARLRAYVTGYDTAAIAATGQELVRATD